MKVLKPIFKLILDSANGLPPENGGILGGEDRTITTFYPDEGIRTERMCSYHPTVSVLNEVIKKWQSEGIDFMGMYHTHFWNVFSLSEGDKAYIFKILKNMPRAYQKLYFPIIVMPKREMVCYVASIKSGELIVNKEILVICE